MDQFETWIARQRRRLSLGVFLTAFADAMAVFLLVLGTSVLVVKLASPGWWPWVLWLAAGAVPLAAWAWWQSRQKRFSRSQAIALLDSSAGAGGLLMTLSEARPVQTGNKAAAGASAQFVAQNRLPDDAWSERLQSGNQDWRASLPRLRPVRFARRLWLPAVFVIGCCLVPPREARPDAVRPNLVGQQATESLTESLQLLRESEVLEQKETQELEKAIEKLTDETKKTPLTHESWEVVDTLRETMRVRAEESLMSASKARDALDRLAADADPNKSSLTSERREQLEKEAIESLHKLSKNGQFSKASPELQKKLQKLMKDRKLTLSKDPKERDRQLSDLKKFLDSECKKLGKCRGKCKDGQCESDEFNFDQSERDGNGKPGRGGVNRGRGDANLTWGDEAQANGAKFKEIILPPGTPDQPNKEVLSQTAAEPEVQPAAHAPRAAPRASGPETGRETWNRTLRPRHRAAVRSYFESGASR